MSQRSAKPKKSFYKRHGLQRRVRIKDPQIGPMLHDQPEFIQTLNFNGNRTVYVLGEKLTPDTLDAIDQKHMRIDTMIIPQGARMVNSSVLKDLYYSDVLDEQPIDTTDGSLFYPGEAKEDLRLEVCGMVENKYYTDMKIHSCRNKNVGQHHSTDGYRTCPDPQTSPDTDDGGEADNTGRLTHRLVIFHLPHSELVKSQGKYVDPKGITRNNFTIREILIQYFKDTGYSGERNPPITEDTEMKGGVFLIPMIMPDSRAAYYCIPNIAGKSSRQTSVNNLFYSWFMSIEIYNRNQDTYWIGIAGNDATYCYLDDWAIFVCKNSQLLVKPKQEVYKESVLASAIS